MGRYVLDLREIDGTQVALVGGKGASLGELARIAGVRVPPGFCVTTDAFARTLAEAPSIDELVGRLARLEPGDRAAIRALAAGIRGMLEAVAIPDEVKAAIARALARLSEREACAVRSSATAEDLPTASFAGQHDTYLDVAGPSSVLRHVRRCWASLFTERAVTYRVRNGVDHRKVRMAVVVQRMVVPQAAGVLFTADPVTGNRKISCVEATPGTGEALVSGRASPDVFEVRDDVRDGVRDGEAVAGTISMRQRGVDAAPLLTEAQVARLAGAGRRIEAHFGRPQDIEWCLADDELHFVQSRPITTLFPVPEGGDGTDRVYVSVGHQQMMTDAMRSLGISVWQLTAGRPMYEAGGRLFVDVTRELATPATRARLLEGLGRSDPLIRDALETLLHRGDFVPSLPDDVPGAPPAAAPPAGAPPEPIATDPSIVAGLVARSRDAIAALEREIRTKSGAQLLDFILADIQELRRALFDPESHRVIMAAMEASWWLDERLEAWLGVRHAAHALTRSVPNDVTSEMGLALLDVADAIRPHPEVVAFLQRVAERGPDDDGREGGRFLDELPRLAGGREASDAIRGWLDAYGMRCVGEIDITRPRWSERPAALVPLLLGNVRSFAPGAAGRRFEQGRREARATERALLERLRALPDGERKAAEAKRMIDRLRTFIGYREYPKYGMVGRYFVYRRALMAEAERLVEARVLRARDDVFYLTLQELRDVVRTGRVDDRLLRRRREAFRSYQRLVPPRVLTSDGEAIPGAYRRDDVPPGALVGLAVSAGTVEGRARVVADMAEAELEPGDVLVTTYTDPSWTPLFVAIGGLVTEVGGLMTHGAVVAREYGLPAVVGVEHATRRIRDGQRIRVHGTGGYVEILS